MTEMLTIANPLENANLLLNQLAGCMGETLVEAPTEPLFVGVDVGTANVVSVVVDTFGTPVAGEITPARVVREGMVTDYLGAVNIVRNHIQTLTQRLDQELFKAASAIPPGTEGGNSKVTRYILEAANLEVTRIIDEPTAASLVLGIDEGVVVDVGGGTTGISVLENGRVIYTADEPTGGFHLDLVIAGNYKISTEEAEVKKRDPREQAMMFPVVRPVFEKIASIVKQHLKGFHPRSIYLVGGTCSYPGFDFVIQQETGCQTFVPQLPYLVTPLGIALSFKE
ncbi:MAG: ethanolamine utilization protein EutJ [Syntrophomonadaceae bacterium]|nr:ethanolamine utilization protein EutJ [Syntrophomonadaceae bacterium]